MRWLTAGLIVACSSPLSARGESPPVDFTRDIRPILSEHCFQCHGPDSKKRTSKLRLDTRAGAFANLGDYQAIVPRKPDESEIYLRLTDPDPLTRMPPEEGKPLTQKQIHLIRRWIEQGATWSDHWSFVPPRRPALPTVQQADWARGPTDRFVLARLEREGMSPAPEADRVTLLRRLHLDLIGLPPTPAEVDAFESDPNESAYERVVDRLLASPHFGERWGRHWLDAARYADSDGYEKDKSRQVWFYRDWVVQAINRNLPYDQFIVHQLAGDQIPHPTQDSIVATGFLRNSMINEEGGIDPEQFRMEAMFDRMDAIGKGILGLTIQCAQCHGHKYDPLSQEEYYQMFAFLNNAHEGSIATYTPEHQMVRAEIFEGIRRIEGDLRHRDPDWQKRMSRWESEVWNEPTRWSIVKPELDASGGQKHYVLDDGSILAAGYAPTKHTTEFTVTTKDPKLTAFRLELLNDPNLPLGGPGRSIHGLCALTEFRATVAPLDALDKRQDVVFSKAISDANPAEKPLDSIFDDKSNKKRVTGPIEYANDGNDLTAWSIDIGPGRSNVARRAVFVLDKPIEDPAGFQITFKLAQNHGGWNSDDNQNNNLGRFRFSVTSDDPPAFDPVPPGVRSILAIEPSQRTPEQQAAVFSTFRTTVAEWSEANQAIEQLWARHPPSASQLVLMQRDMPRRTSVLARGDFLKPLTPVQPAVPGFLNPLPKEHSNDRLTFARWIVSDDAPTTARAIVNRVWQNHFGTGLVSTSEDLGSQGEFPSHPELLDWLALELMESGWDMKGLHRRIVTSATYRQSSKVSPESYARDPFNRWLGRGARFRVEGEIVRDIALAASGLLESRLGGPSVYPPAPAFLFIPPASYGPKTWGKAKGFDRYRRALYTFRFRSVPYPALQAFDSPNGDFSCVKRVRSNTPLQALTTLNEPLFLECSAGLARRILREEGGTDGDKLAFAFRLCTGRRPQSEEAKILGDLIRHQRDHYRRDESAAKQLAALLPTGVPGINDAELAAWTAVGRVLLNLDETITRE